MPYFSRLTDIVTCSLTAILEDAANPSQTLGEIIHEMEDGLAGAQRSVQTAEKNRLRLQQELEEASRQADHFDQQARTALQNNDENAARTALYRKKEANDLKAGLEQQVSVAQSTHEALMTTYRALEARLAEARRKMTEYGISEPEQSRYSSLTDTAHEARQSEIEEELESLKKQMSQS